MKVSKSWRNLGTNLSAVEWAAKRIPKRQYDSNLDLRDLCDVCNRAGAGGRSRGAAATRGGSGTPAPCLPGRAGLQSCKGPSSIRPLPESGWNPSSGRMLLDRVLSGRTFAPASAGLPPLVGIGTLKGPIPVIAGKVVQILDLTPAFGSHSVLTDCYSIIFPPFRTTQPAKSGICARSRLVCAIHRARNRLSPPGIRPLCICSSN